MLNKIIFETALYILNSPPIMKTRHLLKRYGGMSKEDASNLLLRKLARKNDAIRRDVLKKYGFDSSKWHRNVPVQHDDLDRFLWAYEKRMDVERFTLVLVTGRAYGVGYLSTLFAFYMLLMPILSNLSTKCQPCLPSTRFKRPNCWHSNPLN